MSKSEIIERIAEEAEISKAAAGIAFRTMIEEIKAAVSQGDQVSIIGFGTFMRASYDAKMGINPRTREKIQIAARKAPKFKAGKAFKDLVNSK